MVLAIDIGNSDIVLGGYENDTLRFTSRCGTDRRKTADEYALLFKGILELYNASPGKIKGGIVASVVPSLRIIVQQAMERLTHATFLTLAAGRKTGLNIRLDWLRPPSWAATW
ncbi:MAG: type III pantothenate kinase [Oscillospiraceae bacterium]